MAMTIATAMPMGIDGGDCNDSGDCNDVDDCNDRVDGAAMETMSTTKATRQRRWR